MKPAQDKIDWRLHTLQLLAWMASQEENMQDPSYEQWDTLRQNTSLNLFEHIVESAKLTVLESHIAFSPSRKAQPSDARNSLPTKLHKFKANKANRKKQGPASHLSFKGHSDFFWAASSPI